MHLASPSYMLRALLISLFVMWSPEYLVRSEELNFLLVQSSPIPRHLVPHRPKYLPQHPILENPQRMFLPVCEGPSFTPTHNIPNELNTEFSTAQRHTLFPSSIGSTRFITVANYVTDASVMPIVSLGRVFSPSVNCCFTVIISFIYKFFLFVFNESLSEVYICRII